MVRTILAVSLIVMLASSAHAAAAPFFMFAASRFSGAEQAQILTILRANARPSDYLSMGLVRNDPQLTQAIGTAHVFALPPSVRAASRMTQQCGASIGMIIYDGEHWADTPADEQADMPSAISRAKSAARGGNCQFGVAPDGEYVGIVPGNCSYELNRAIHRNVDWDDIALFNIQAQRLLSDKCAAQGGVDKYIAFVTTVANEVRAKNASTKISAQMSMRYTPPGRMIDVIRRLRGVVDGFYIAYPSNQGRCQYCTPQNLAQVLAAIRSS